VDSSIALRQAALLVAVVVAYLFLCRRFRVLTHPLSIALAVTVVGIAVSVLNVIRGGAWADVTPMAARSAIGSAMWGLLIGGVYWVGRVVFLRLRRSR
jgi:hypothetical protein